ncbi:related to GPI-anchor transamidase [Saccharomycodes ludwigii]|uniref:Related to GPI-anchor transamidase n=2 Tax=Saccharomycodes ludwigii TaxID=36035 RepID=A0A376B4D9_9ASCO|nr:related to GPI-anchor transamidase [Saccharomycodes ludwigii]
MANVLSMYRTVKRLGIPDSQIILMLSDDVSCNSRNLFPGAVFNNKDHMLDLYGESVEVDYRGYEVTVENFIRLLTDRWDEDHPKSKRLLTNENSNIFIYMTGHGGADFLKFQDAEEIASLDIANAFHQMYEKKRYNEIFFMIDTCQANTMYSKFYSPNILACGSSEFEESSYSHHSDVELGVAVIDRFTYYSLEFLENIKDKTSNLTMKDLFDYLTFDKVHSHTGVRTDLFKRNVSDVLITDFFGNVQEIIPDLSDSDGNNIKHGINDEEDYYIEKTVLDLAIEASGNSSDVLEENKTNTLVLKENDINKYLHNTIKSGHDAANSKGEGPITWWKTLASTTNGVIFTTLCFILYKFVIVTEPKN